MKISYLLLVLLALASPIYSQRLPVLKQIDVPHAYYYREMFLPQLTSGPSSVDWSPDGKSLIYAMGGTLWQQEIGSTTAKQLTHSRGYDYQPDWSPDGTTIVFVRYEHDAMDIYLLDLKSGTTTPLTSGGNVNVEPRFSPDGSRIAFTSTKDTGHFRTWIGKLTSGQLDATPLSAERKTPAPRYYYSAFDHQLSPAWSPDGKSLVLVSNPDILHGSGAIFRVEVDKPYQPVLLREEETNWRTRPDWSPDGSRIVYSSYLGQQWHQLWVTTATGKGYPIPMGYGAFDATYARWSPNGKQIAYISNESGNTQLFLMDVASSKKERVILQYKQFIEPMATLTIRTIDSGNRETAARLSVQSGGKSYAPDAAWMHGDETFDRSKQQYETHYFHSAGEATITLPAGTVTLTAWHGFENEIYHDVVELKPNEQKVVDVKFVPITIPAEFGQWKSGDVHVHMNYGGHYRNTPENLVKQAQAEDLDLVYNLVVNKEQRIPDIAYFSPAPDPASNSSVTFLHGQEFHTSYWGHLGLLGLEDHYLLPGYTYYTQTGVASGYPNNAAVADLAHKQRGMVGYVHPFDFEPDLSAPWGYSLPVDVALGKVDYYEVQGYSDHHITAKVWYRLMNCGFRITPVGGTDAMPNFATLRGPVGLERVFTKIGDGSPIARQGEFLKSIKNGKTFTSNGPLVGLLVEGKEPGEEILLAGKGKLKYKGFMRSALPIDKLEVVLNGEVIQSITLTGDHKSADFTGVLNVQRSGWVLVRAYSKSSPDLLDLYPYATTNAVFIAVNGQPLKSKEDVNYFLKWIDLIEEAANKIDTFIDETEKQTVYRDIREARRIFSERSK